MWKQDEGKTSTLGWLSHRGDTKSDGNTLGALLTVPEGRALCGALGGELPARAKEPLVGVHLLIEDGEPGRGSGLHGHFGAFLGFLGAGESDKTQG